MGMGMVVERGYGMWRDVEGDWEGGDGVGVVTGIGGRECVWGSGMGIGEGWGVVGEGLGGG